MNKHVHRCVFGVSRGRDSKYWIDCIILFTLAAEPSTSRMRFLAAILLSPTKRGHLFCVFVVLWLLELYGNSVL